MAESNNNTAQIQKLTPSENIKRLHENLMKKDGFNVPFDKFFTDMQDENNLTKLHQNLTQKDGFNVPYDRFKTDMFPEQVQPEQPVVQQQAPAQDISKEITAIEPEDNFWHNTAVGRGLASSSRAAVTSMGIGLKEGALKVNELMKKDPIWGGSAKYQEWLNKKDAEIKEDISDIKEWSQKGVQPEEMKGTVGEKIGGLLPFATMVIGTAVTKSPAMAQATTGMFGLMGYGEGIEAYDNYNHAKNSFIEQFNMKNVDPQQEQQIIEQAKQFDIDARVHNGHVSFFDEEGNSMTGEPVNEAKRNGAGLLYAAVMALPMGHYAGKMIPRSLFRRVAPKLLNPEVMGKSGQAVWESFIKNNPSAAKKFATEMAKKTGHSVMTMEQMELGKMAVDQFLIDRDVTPKEFWQRTWGGIESGVLFAMVTGPFGAYNQTMADRNQWRKDGSVIVGAKEDGTTFWVTGAVKNGKQQGKTPDGKLIDLTDRDLNSSVKIPADVFEKSITEAKKTGKLYEGAEYDAVKGNLVDFAKRITIEMNGQPTTEIHAFKDSNGRRMFVKRLNNDGTADVITEDGQMVKVNQVPTEGLYTISGEQFVAEGLKRRFGTVGEMEQNNQQPTAETQKPLTPQQELTQAREQEQVKATEAVNQLLHETGQVVTIKDKQGNTHFVKAGDKGDKAIIVYEQQEDGTVKPKPFSPTEIAEWVVSSPEEAINAKMQTFDAVVEQELQPKSGDPVIYNGEQHTIGQDLGELYTLVDSKGQETEPIPKDVILAENPIEAGPSAEGQAPTPDQQAPAPTERPVVTQNIGGKQIDIVENDGFDEVIASDKMPLDKVLPVLEKKFKDNKRFKLEVDKVQQEIPGETKWDEPTYQTIIKSIKIVPRKAPQVDQQKELTPEEILQQEIRQIEKDLRTVRPEYEQKLREQLAQKQTQLAELKGEQPANIPNNESTIQNVGNGTVSNAGNGVQSGSGSEIPEIQEEPTGAVIPNDSNTQENQTPQPQAEAANVQPELKPTIADPTEPGGALFEQLRSELESATGEEYPDEAVMAHVEAAGGWPTTEVKAKKPKALSKEQQEVLDFEVYTPREIALKHFASGGKINMEALQYIFGGSENGQAKSVEGERKARISYYSPEGMSVDQIAHYLWQNENPTGQFNDVDFRDAVIDVIQSYNSPQAMAKDLIKANTIPEVIPEEQPISETEYAEYSYLDNIPERIIDKYNNGETLTSEDIAELEYLFISNEQIAELQDAIKAKQDEQAAEQQTATTDQGAEVAPNENRPDSQEAETITAEQQEKLTESVNNSENNSEKLNKTETPTAENQPVDISETDESLQKLDPTNKGGEQKQKHPIPEPPQSEKNKLSEFKLGDTVARRTNEETIHVYKIVKTNTDLWRLKEVESGSVSQWNALNNSGFWLIESAPEQNGLFDKLDKAEKRVDDKQKISKAEKEVNPNPTDAQKEAGTRAKRKPVSEMVSVKKVVESAPEPKQEQETDKFKLPPELDNASFKSALAALHKAVDNNPEGFGTDDQEANLSALLKDTGYQGKWGRDDYGNERMYFVKKEESKPNQEPKQVDVEGLVNNLKEKGKAKLSDNVKKEPKIFKEDDAKAAIERLKAKLGGNTTNEPESSYNGKQNTPALSFADMNDANMAAGYFIELGNTKFADFAKAMTDAIGPNIEPYLKGTYEYIRRVPGMEETAKEMDSTEFVDKFDFDAFNSPEVKKVHPKDYHSKTEYVRDAVMSFDVFGNWPSHITNFGEVFADVITQSGGKNSFRLAAKPNKKDVERLAGQVWDAYNIQKEETQAEATNKPTFTTAVKEGTHTKTGEKLFIVNPAERVDRDIFNDLRSIAKKHGGRWSNYKPNNGFLFKSQEDANNFRQEVEKEYVGEALAQEKRPAPQPKPVEKPETTSIPLIDNLNNKENDFGKSPKIKLADNIKQRIANREAITNTPQLTALAEQAGLKLGEHYNDVKELYDIASSALNQYIIENDGLFAPQLNSTPGAAKDVVKELMDLQDLLPTETQRSATMVELQQFSTPLPFAFVANWIAQVNDKDVMLEPSAGEGNIATFAKATGARVITNEIDKNRSELLKALGFDKITNEDAKHLHAVKVLKDEKVTVVVMNPPFSKDVAMGGKMDLHAAEKHIDAALSKLEDEGRLVAIVGRGMSFDSPTHKAWWNKIKKNYQVRANVLVSGKGYSKKGTNFDNRLLVIDKNGETFTSDPIVITDANNYPELIDILKHIPKKPRIIKQNENSTANSNGQTQPTSGTTSKPGTGNTNVGGTGLFDFEYPRPTENGGSDTGLSNGNKRGNSDLPGSNGTGNSNTTGSSTNTGSNRRPATDKSSVRGNETKSGQLSDKPENKSGRTIQGEKLSITHTPRKTEKNTGDLGYEQYTPEYKVENSKQHPTKLVESTAMGSVSLPKLQYTPYLPKKTVESGALSDAQLEDVVLAGNSHNQILPSGERRGYFLGAGTGYGKGRTLAGIMLDNYNQGRKKAVWVSKNEKAHYDSKEYWEAVGGDPKEIFWHKPARTPINKKEGVLLMTYGTLKSGFNPNRFSDNTSEDFTFWRGPHESRLQQIAQWLGKDFDGVIVFDESHKMANAKDSKGERGTKKASVTALAGIELQRLLPKARIVYSSATGATEVSNLAYAQRLGLWGDGTPFDNSDSFITAVESSGVAGMEIISKDLKTMGLYTAKTLSFDGVQYETVQHQLMPEQRKLYDQVAEAWQTVLNNINDAIDLSGASRGAKTAAYSRFWGAHQRFFSQIIMTMQMPSVLEDIQKSLSEDKAVVIQIVNTNEAATKRALAEAKARDGENVDYDSLDLSPKASLIEYVRTGFPVAQFETTIDAEGNEVTTIVRDSEGNIVENPELVARRDNLIDRLNKELTLPESPLDIIMNTFGAENIAEITGRTLRVVQKVDDNGNIAKVEESRTTAQVAKDKDDFMDGKKNLLVFSDAGGTGASFHADLNRKNQKQRVHYVLQAGWRADSAVQGFGRTHRSNQRIAPIFKLVTTDLKAQRRFLSSIARRLDQLGALTKGQRQTGGQGVLDGSFNLEGTYAKQALFEFYQDVEAGRVEGVDMPVLEEQMALKIYSEDADGNRTYNDSVIFNTKMFLNRIMSLKVDLMDSVFDGFISRLENMITNAKEAGSFDEGIQVVDAKGTKVVDEKIIYTDSKTGGETFLTTIELELDNDKRTWDNIQAEIDRYGEEKFHGFYQEENSGRIYAIIKQRVVGADGVRETKYKRMSVVADSFIESRDLYQKYNEVPQEQAKELWEADYEKHPGTRKKTEQIVKGLILPIWNRLPEKINVRRYIDDDGVAHLGRFFSRRDIENITRTFDVANNQAYPTAQLIHTIQNGGQVKLANGFELTKAKYMGNDVIRINNANPYRDRDRLTRAGATFKVQSSLSMSGDFYLPINVAAKGIETITELYNSPATSVEDAEGNFVSPDKSGNFGTNETVQEPQQAYGKRGSVSGWKQSETGREYVHTNGSRWEVPQGRSLKAETYGKIKQLIDNHRIKEFDPEKFDYWFNKLRENSRTPIPELNSYGAKGDNTTTLALNIYDKMPGSSLYELHESETAYGSKEQEQQAILQTVREIEQLSLNFGEDSEGGRNSGQRKTDLHKIRRRTILEKFKESGYVDFIGQQIESIQDIADLWSVHRSPKIEKFHAIFLNNGKVVGTTALTTNLIYASKLPHEDYIHLLYNKYGADQVYYLHNHPSGNHNVSTGDVSSTANHKKLLEAKGVNLQGHIVIDTNKFSYINITDKPYFGDNLYSDYQRYIDNEVEQHEYKNPVAKLFHEREQLPKDAEGERLYQIGRALLAEYKYRGAIVYLSQNNQVAAYDPFPEGATTSSVVRLMKMGLNVEKVGSNAVVIHDGSFDFSKTIFPNRTLDVIDTDTGLSTVPMVEDPIDLQARSINQLWIDEPVKSNYTLLPQYLDALQAYRDNQKPTPPTDGPGNGISEPQQSYNRKQAPVFFSPTEKALNYIKQEKGTPQQMHSMLLKNGAKQAELDWMDWESFIDNKKSVTKQEVQDWINQNRVKVEEVEHKFPYGDEFDSKRYIVLNEEGFDPIGEHMPLAEAETEVRAAREEHGETWTIEPYDDPYAIDDIGNQPKYSEYQLSGGKNYRELLLTMPGKEPEGRPYHIVRDEVMKPILKELGLEKSEEALRRKTSFDTQWRDFTNDSQYDEAVKVENTLIENGYEDSLNEYRESFVYSEKSEKLRKSDFKSGHWDEPNILAHIRFNERKDADGKKVLFLEEIQSDWAQKGKKEGFNILNKLTTAEEKELQKLNRTTFERELTNEEEKRRLELKEKVGDSLNQKAKENGKVADMPFKKTDQWVNLAVRRMIRYAAENGFDRIAWTTGEQQAERYDLSKQVDIIFHKKNNDGTYRIEALPKGAGTPNAREVVATNAKESELEGIVGKDLAQKIIDTPETDDTFGGMFAKKGADLKVGGEGMKAFYNSIVPKLAGKLGKKFGAKVERIDLQFGKKTFDDKNPKNLTADYYWPGIDISMIPGNEFIKKGDYLIQHHNGNGNYIWSIPKEEASGWDEAIERYYQILEENGDYIRPKPQGQKEVLSMPITEKMKYTAVNEGMSLFEPAPTYSRKAQTVNEPESGYTPSNPDQAEADETVAPHEEIFKLFRDDWFANKDEEKVLANIDANNQQQRIKATFDKNNKQGAKKWQDIDEAIHLYLDIQEKRDQVRIHWKQLSTKQQRLVNLALSLTPEQKEIAQEMRDIYDLIGQRALSEEVISNVLENYVARTWDMAGRQGDEFFTKFNLKTRHAKRRTLGTILEGWAKGYELKIKGATTNLEVLRVEINNVIENKRLMNTGLRSKDENDRPLFTTYKYGGYQEIKHPNFVKWVKVKSAPEGQEDEADREIKKPQYKGDNVVILDDGTVFEKRKVYAPEYIAKNLNNILGKSPLYDVPGVKAITKFNATVKATVLSWSFFHHMAFSRSYLLGSALGWNIKDWNLIGAYKDGLNMLSQKDPSVMFLVRNGLTIGRNQEWDEMAVEEKGNITKWLDKMNVIPEAREKIYDLHKNHVNFLFAKFGAGLKVKSAMLEFNHLLHKYPERDPEMIAKAVAQQTNADFGGLHLERMGRNKGVQHFLRLALLAPDWTESNVQTMVKSVQSPTLINAYRKLNNAKRKLSGKEKRDLLNEDERKALRFERRMYQRFWKRAFLRTAFVSTALNLAMALLIKGLFNDDDEKEQTYWDTVEEMYRQSFENPERANWLSVDVTPLYEIMSNEEQQEGDPEKRKYFSVLGHFYDPAKFIISPFQSLKNKSSIIGSVGMEFYSGENWQGKRYTSLPELMGTDDKGVYMTSSKKHGYRVGDPKGGQHEGQLTRWRRSGDYGPVKYEELPSFMLSTLRGTLPIPMQNGLSYALGEISGFDALAHGAGIHLKSNSSYPTLQKEYDAVIKEASLHSRMINDKINHNEGDKAIELAQHELTYDYLKVLQHDKLLKSYREYKLLAEEKANEEMAAKWQQKIDEKMQEVVNMANGWDQEKKKDNN